MRYAAPGVVTLPVTVFIDSAGRDYVHPAPVTRVTPRPTSTTVPVHSWPGTIGIGEGQSPFMMCQSLWQIPAAFTQGRIPPQKVVSRRITSTAVSCTFGVAHAADSLTIRYAGDLRTIMLSGRTFERGDDELAAAMGDFADLISPWLAGHSQPIGLTSDRPSRAVGGGRVLEELTEGDQDDAEPGPDRVGDADRHAELEHLGQQDERDQHVPHPRPRAARVLQRRRVTNRT